MLNISYSSYHLLELIAAVPSGRLTKQKMMTIDDIVHSQLFKMPECRSVLLPGFTVRIKELLERRTRDEVRYIKDQEVVGLYINMIDALIQCSITLCLTAVSKAVFVLIGVNTDI